MSDYDTVEDKIAIEKSEETKKMFLNFSWKFNEQNKSFVASLTSQLEALIRGGGGREGSGAGNNTASEPLPQNWSQYQLW